MSEEYEVSQEKNLDLTTECHRCVFAEFDLSDEAEERRENLGDNTVEQIGCHLGRLEKFEERGELLGTAIIPHPEGYDVEANVVNRLCSTCRDDRWAEAQDIEGLYNLAKKVLDDIELQYDIVLIENESDDLLVVKNRMLSSLLSFQDANIKPRNVSIVLNTAVRKDMLKIVDFLNEAIDNNGLGLKFKVTKVVEEDADIGRALDMGIKHCNGMYYCVMNNGLKIDPSYFDRLHKAVNEDLRKIILVRGEENHDGLVVLRKLHNVLSGNKSGTLSEKVDALVAFQDKPEMVVTWDEL